MSITLISVDQKKDLSGETLRMKLRNKLYPAFGVLSAPDFVWSKLVLIQVIESVWKAYELCFRPEDKERCLKVRAILVRYPHISSEEAESGQRIIGSILESVE